MGQLPQSVLDFIEKNSQHHFDITCELAQIPAPSNHEEKRAEWVKNYLESFGAQGVHIDKALNVVWPIGVTEDNPVVVMMAHTDVVFPDTTPLPLEIRDGKIFCPGIGDDTTNLTTMLVIGKYIQEQGLKPAGDYGVLIVANSGEEGLGNLKGTKEICETYAGRIVEFTTFDGTFSFLCDNAVGSHRYEVTLKTEGGHSYGAFGNRNAIAFLASMISTLYTVKVPPYGKTTYNVGGISGGTSVNTIAQSATMLYEYRSDDQRSLAEMEVMFKNVIEAYRAMGVEVEVNVLGIRPCRGDVDMDKLGTMVKRAQTMLKTHTGLDVPTGSGSTDANIPLSLGIPAICFGLLDGAGAHTREEWVSIESLKQGLPLCAEYMLHYFK
jgi:acetylornithine deacetylase/succinyl-diaminopimelate desuccinylase-like protein